jgi:phospholipid/cholesterol/gamma-HCH transport system substrate-binding protein
VGDAYFEITRGQGDPLPEKGAAIVCNEPHPSDVEAAVESIRREAVPALKKLSAGLDTWTMLGSNLISSRERLDRIFARADNIAASLEQGKGTAGELLTDSSVVDDLRQLLENANQSIDQLQATLTNLQQVSDNLHLASTNLPTISNNINNTGKDLPGLVWQAQMSMLQLEHLIEALERHWLIRKYVNKYQAPTNTPSLPPLPPQ